MTVCALDIYSVCVKCFIVLSYVQWDNMQFILEVLQYNSCQFTSVYTLRSTALCRCNRLAVAAYDCQALRVWPDSWQYDMQDGKGNVSPSFWQHVSVAVRQDGRRYVCPSFWQYISVAVAVRQDGRVAGSPSFWQHGSRSGISGGIWTKSAWQGG